MAAIRRLALRAAAIALLAAPAAQADTAYRNYLLPYVNAPTYGSGQFGHMLSGTTLFAFTKPTGQRPTTPGTAGRPAAASTAQAGTPRHPIDATDFRPAGRRDVPEQFTRSVPAAERARTTRALRQVIEGIEASGGFRGNNLAYALAVLVGIGKQTLDGTELDDARSLALARRINDELVDRAAMSKLSPEQRTQLYDTALLTGGLIAGIAQMAKEDNQPELAEQARAMARDALAGLGLDGMAPTASASPGATVSAPIWGLWQYAPPEGEIVRDPAMRAWQWLQGRSFCQFALYLSVAGTPDPRADFVADWDQLGKARGISSPAPTPTRAAAPNGWTRLEAQREEHAKGTGRYTVRQVTYSGHGRRMSAIVTSNDLPSCGARIDAFMASLVPLPPADGQKTSDALRQPGT